MELENEGLEYKDGDLRNIHLKVREEPITGKVRTQNRNLSLEVHS